MAFPREHWVQIALTTPLERVNREIKRRADVIGIFPNDEAIIRLVGASAMGLEPMAASWRTARDQ
jgi:transposase-like protein